MDIFIVASQCSVDDKHMSSVGEVLNVGSA